MAYKQLLSCGNSGEFDVKFFFRLFKFIYDREKRFLAIHHSFSLTLSGFHFYRIISHESSYVMNIDVDGAFTGNAGKTAESVGVNKQVANSNN